MTTGITLFNQQATEFDSFFSKNYKLLLSKSNYFFSKAGREEVIDQLTEAYLKIKSRISKSGYTGTNYTAYVYSTLFNQFRHSKNVAKRQRAKGFQMIDVSDEAYEDYVEEKQQFIDALQKDDAQYNDDINHFYKTIIAYIKNNYEPKSVHLFLQYVLTKGDTYSKLSTRTGINKAIISQTISNIKKDLQNRYGRWRIVTDDTGEVYEINRITKVTRTRTK